MAPSETPQAVFVSALQNDIDTMRTLLPQHVNAATPEGYTPLSLATFAHHVGIVQLPPL